jgi:ribosomal protein L25 (general stress protein Ctc)
MPVVKDPGHPEFPHGEERGYFRGCRDGCPAAPTCREAHNRAGLRRKYARALGRGAHVPTGEIRRHLVRLLGGGSEPWRTRATIAKAAGIKRATSVVNIVNGSQRYVDRGWAQALMAVTEESMIEAADLVDPAPYFWKLRVLQAQGWSLRQLWAQACNRDAPRSPGWLYRQQRYIMREVAERINALWDEYHLRPGPSKHVARHARKAGYYPAACYDDDGNLIPEAIRRDDAEEARAEEAEQAAARRVHILVLTFAGHNSSTVAERVGTYSKDVLRTLRMVGLHATADREAHTVTTDAAPVFVEAVRDAWHRVDVAHHNPEVVWAALVELADQLARGDWSQEEAA